jgi:DNA-binding NarL/FixJ family response regulator
MTDCKRLLIIDDSRVSRMKLRQLVLQKRPQWQIVEASSGEEGVQVAQTVEPDMVILDFNMPGIDGFETFQQIQAQGSQAKFVFLSGNIQNVLRRRVEAQGVSLVEKPITVAAVDEALGHLER